MEPSPSPSKFKEINPWVESSGTLPQPSSCQMLPVPQNSPLLHVNPLHFYDHSPIQVLRFRFCWRLLLPKRLFCFFWIPPPIVLSFFLSNPADL